MADGVTFFLDSAMERRYNTLVNRISHLKHLRGRVKIPTGGTARELNDPVQPIR